MQQGALVSADVGNLGKKDVSADAEIFVLSTSDSVYKKKGIKIKNWINNPWRDNTITKTKKLADKPPHTPSTRMSSIVRL